MIESESFYDEIRDAVYIRYGVVRDSFDIKERSSVLYMNIHQT